MTLRAQNVSCERNDRVLFSGLSFTLAVGEVLFVQGMNGAGKTSLLRILAGLGLAASGEIYWHDADITCQREAYCKDLLYIGHQPGIKAGLTAQENLQFYAAMHQRAQSLSKRVSIAAALEQVGLSEYAHRPAQQLSAGQKRRVALARLILSPARLWILDEPFSALDRAGVRFIETLIDKHTAAGGIAIITSHQKAYLPNNRGIKYLSMAMKV